MELIITLLFFFFVVLPILGFVLNAVFTLLDAVVQISFALLCLPFKGLYIVTEKTCPFLLVFSKKNSKAIYYSFWLAFISVAIILVLITPTAPHL